MLEEELCSLQTQFDSEKTMLISKDDHKKFIDQLHEIHSKETSKLKEQVKSLGCKLDQGEQALGKALNHLEQEKAAKADLHNELQYNKMQLTKALEETKTINKRLSQQEAFLAQAKVREELVDKLESRIQEMSQERGSIEAAHRDTVMDLNGKINERDQLISQAAQVKEKFAAREKQLNSDI